MSELSAKLNNIKEHLLSIPSSRFKDRLKDIEDNYNLMLDYFRRGYPDEHRDKMYQQLLKKSDKLLSDIVLHNKLQSNPALNNLAKQATADVADFDIIRREVESIVENHEKHQLFLDNLFDSLWLSEQWTVNDYNFYKDLLTSPLSNLQDSLLIVSALMLANTQQFDELKTLLLVHLSSLDNLDEHLCQRALVGWAISLDSERVYFYPELKKSILNFCNKDANAQQLVELQKQMYFCLGAERDQETIQRDIMPELMKNASTFNIKLTDEDEEELFGEDEDEADDASVEKIEKTFEKMMDMQKAGSDIYFGGFSQMKRFAFFSKTASWFMPFYVEHPMLKQTLDTVQSVDFLNNLLKNAPFCDSDKYSFALAVSNIFNRLPDRVKEMMNGQSVFATPNDNINTDSKVLIRRKYLQDIYRFFKLYTHKSALKNPFTRQQGREKSALFLDNPIFETTPIFSATNANARFVEIGKFLLVRKNFNEFKRFSALLPPESIETDILKAKYAFLTGDFNRTISILQPLAQLDSLSKSSLRCLSRALASICDFQKAADAYATTIDERSDINEKLTLYLLLSHTERVEESINPLYRLSFEQPDNKQVFRVLAWNLLNAGRLAQAATEYENLLSSPDVDANDKLNAAYCFWIKNDIIKACRLFAEANNDIDVARAIENDKNVLIRNGIKHSEINMMKDLWQRQQ